MKDWYYIVTQSMLELGLRGTELNLYALLYGYSQRGDGCYYGTRAALAERCGVQSKRTIDAAIDSLINRGLIRRFKLGKDGQILTAYAVCAETAPGVQKMHRGGANSARGEGANSAPMNNKDIENKDNNFNFQDALIAAGVRKDVVEAWLQVRKAKRAVNTELALKSILREIEKTGRTANECIEIAVEQSWRGFKSDWIDKAANVTAKQMTYDAFLKSTL